MAFFSSPARGPYAPQALRSRAGLRSGRFPAACRAGFISALGFLVGVLTASARLGGSPSAPLSPFEVGFVVRVECRASGRTIIGTGVAIERGRSALTALHVTSCGGDLAVTQGDRRVRARVRTIAANIDAAVLELETALPQYARFARDLARAGEPLTLAGYGSCPGCQTIEWALVLRSSTIAASSSSELWVLGTVFPGDSGAPLVRPNGEVVGMVTEKPMIAVRPRADASAPSVRLPYADGSGLALPAPLLIASLGLGPD